MAYTYFQKICIWTRYSDPKLIKNILKFLVTLLRFWFIKQPKTLNFQSFFTSKKHFVGYFQWNACIYFQKTCIWTRYSAVKLIKNILNFSVALLRFSFRKTTYKSKFSEFFTSNRTFGGYFQSNACTSFQKRCIWRRYSDVKLIKNISNFLVALLRFYFRKRT